MKLAKFLFESDELENAGNKMTTIKNAAKLNPGFWKKLVMEIENCVGYVVDSLLVHDSDNDYDLHVLTTEERFKVKEILKSMFQNKCIVTPTGVVYFDRGALCHFANDSEKRDSVYMPEQDLLDAVCTEWGVTKEELRAITV